MAYLVDRQRALMSGDIVGAFNVSRRRIRSRVVLKDNSLYHTLTRTATIARWALAPIASAVTQSRRGGRNRQGATWWTPR